MALPIQGLVTFKPARHLLFASLNLDFFSSYFNLLITLQNSSLSYCSDSNTK